ncbi:hypothetical protein DVH24_035561 [Malus domestica]|uniref:Uncharacterized protein n=1 Tax=Malus domestica TaxID=3750 RepID=A0A498J7Z0_MALDO|nr:hypothetical protein DVH24_035561 [Malus domestica]
MDRDREANTRCTWFTQIGYIHGVDEFSLIVKGLHKYIGSSSPLVSTTSHTLDQDSVKQKPIYGADKSFINGGQPQFSKASHTLDQNSVKQNQFMVPTKASSNEFNHNSQKFHTLLIKTV